MKKGVFFFVLFCCFFGAYAENYTMRQLIGYMLGSSEYGLPEEGTEIKLNPYELTVDKQSLEGKGINYIVVPTGTAESAIVPKGVCIYGENIKCLRMTTRSPKGYQYSEIRIISPCTIIFTGKFVPAIDYNGNRTEIPLFVEKL